MITFGYGHEEQGCLVFNILIAGTSIMKTMDWFSCFKWLGKCL